MFDLMETSFLHTAVLGTQARLKRTGPSASWAFRIQQLRWRPGMELLAWVCWVLIGSERQHHMWWQEGSARQGWLWSSSSPHLTELPGPAQEISSLIDSPMGKTARWTNMSPIIERTCLKTSSTCRLKAWKVVSRQLVWEEPCTEPKAGYSTKSFRGPQLLTANSSGAGYPGGRACCVSLLGHRWNTAVCNKQVILYFTLQICLLCFTEF